MKNFIKQCQEAYANGNPILSNEEYDALVARFPDAEEDIGQAGDIPHLFRMYSLEKKYPCRGDVLPTNKKDYVVTPKLDGCAVDLLYVDGKLQQCLTRGDGIKGKDQTANLSQLVPATFDSDDLIVQITGEVCVSKKVDNMRNYASGAVNLKDPVEFHSRIGESGLMFVAYNIQVSDKYSGIQHTFVQDMEELRCQGFNTVLEEEIMQFCREGLIPTDGEVHRLNSNDKFFKSGFTHKFPKGAFAVKEDEEGVITTVRAIEWNTGKTGKVTPVAIFDEIELEGAKTTRATLNNVAFMEGLGLTHIGQQVRVIRAGGIIPKIIEVL